ncbi:MAG: exo-beta-N-acetylmuramidase NamZ domain-containing protein [Eubacteriales bacterium]
MTNAVKSGAEVLEGLPGKKSIRAGLITNPTGVTASLRPTYDIIEEKFTLTALFSPEHGVRGNVQAGGEVTEYVDDATGLPVYSTYGRGKNAAHAAMRELDCVFFDIADVGARYYTYPYTMTEAMETCAGAGVPFVVLDRPPVIGCFAEGNLLDVRYSSFVGKYATAARTGLTIGEFARYINETEAIGCRLTVVPCEGVRRTMYFEETGLPFVMPSPNLPTVDAALVYVGTCLIEGTNLSEGRGTTKPFEMFGAPWLRARDVRAKVGKPDGALLRETYFTPQFSKHAGVLCAGLQLHVTDRRAFRPFETAVRLLSAIREIHPEFEYTSFIKNLFGSGEICADSFDCEQYLAGLSAPLEAYRRQTADFFLYEA